MIRTTILLGILLLSSQFTFPQAYGENKFQFISSKTKQITLPFETVNNLIIIKVAVNNSKNFNFILDSGVRTTIITSLEPQETLKINKARKIEVNGLGSSKPVEAFYSTNNQIFIGDIVGINQNLIVLLSDIFHLKSKLGMPIHGIIGYDLIKDFVIRISYHDKKISFINPNAFKYKKRMGQIIPITIFNKKPYLEAEIKNCTNQLKKVKLLIDTGGSMPLWLFPDENKGICIPEKTIKANLGTGLNGLIKGKIGRIQTLKIGKYTFENPICNYPDSSSVFTVVSIDKRSGSVGAEILRRFVFYLNYTNNQIIIRRSNYYSRPFEYNMSGIEISKPYPILPIYIISVVRKNSNAEKAGLKSGDQILFINGNNSTQLSLDQLNALLHSRKNKKIKMTIKRGNKEINIHYRLERII